MANVIKIKRSPDQHATPSTLEYGELAINYADGKLYYKNLAGSLDYFESRKDNVTIVNGQATCQIDIVTMTLVSDDENQILDSTIATSIKYLIQANHENDIEITEILAIKRGDSVNHVEYGRVSMFSDLASYNVIESSGAIRLTVSPVNENTKFDILKTIIIT
jgi:hypothetical protein